MFLDDDHDNILDFDGFGAIFADDCLDPLWFPFDQIGIKLARRRNNLFGSNPFMWHRATPRVPPVSAANASPKIRKSPNRDFKFSNGSS